MGSLYVGDLRTDVGEFDLLRIFNAVGKISSIHVCRDTETKKSLGYAYVNYCKHRSAENALIQLNYLNIKGKSCRVMWSHHAKELNVTEGGNVFVKNLHKEICNKDLHEIFSAFGKIISCKVAMNEQQRSLGFGYVHFERVVDAERAIKKANRMSINGKEVHVEYFRCKGERIQQNTTKESQPTHSNLPQENRTNLYVNNLDTKITDGMLEGLFLRFGKITSAKIERNQHNVSKQFGFVCFRMPNAATEAIEEMNGTTISDRLIYVGYAQKKSERKEFLSQQFNTSRAGPARYTPNPDVAYERLSDHVSSVKIRSVPSSPTREFSQNLSFEQQTKDPLTPYGSKYQTQINSEINQVKQQKRQETQGMNLFVKNLEDEITDEILRTHFVPFGVITSCKVMRDDTNHTKGFGFVCYETPEEATKAVTELNGKIIMNKPLYVNIAKRKEERRALLTQQFVNRQMTHISRQNPQHLASGMMQGPPQQPKDMSTKPINITHLTSADPKQQKQILGETLFPIIYRKYPQQAGKITGMLLKLEISELLFLLDSGEQLNAKMEEAYEVLQKHQVSVPGVPQ